MDGLPAPAPRGSTPSVSDPAPHSTVSAPETPAQQAQTLAALQDVSRRMADLYERNLNLQAQRNDQLATILERINAESEQLFAEVRDTMELAQEMIAQLDPLMGKLGTGIASLGALEMQFRQYYQRLDQQQQRQ